MPKGSKIFVGSIRGGRDRKGRVPYVADFDNMVNELLADQRGPRDRGAAGDPIYYEGMNKVGRDLSFG
jgi:hypothetical protein